MKNTKTQEGITLIALILTIIVLVILAVVAINAVNSTGVIVEAEDAAAKYSAAQEEEQILLGVNEWMLVKYSNKAETTFEEFMKTKLGSKATVSEVAEGKLSISYTGSKNGYEVTERGELTATNKPGTETFVSIEGTYGYVADNSEERYYVFNKGTVENGVESGTGTLVCYDGSPEVETTVTFNYTVSVDKIVTIDNGGESFTTFAFEPKKDSNGNVVNKLLYCGEKRTMTWEDGTYAGNIVSIHEGILTTNGSEGVTINGTKTYTVVDTGGIASITFENDKITVINTDGEIEWQLEGYIIKDNIVYISDGYENMFFPYIILWNENHAEFPSS